MGNCSRGEVLDMMESLTNLCKALANIRAGVEIPEGVAIIEVHAGRYGHPASTMQHTREDVRAWIEETGLKIAYESIEESEGAIRAELPFIER